MSNKKSSRRTPKHSPYVIIASLAALAVAVALIVYAISNHSATPAARFAAEYENVGLDNPFVEKTGEETINILEHGTGVLFLGFPTCPWCQAYVGYLNEVAHEQNLDTIFYHNTYDDWQNNTEDYQKITALLSDYLQYDNEGNKHLYVPNVTVIKDGEILFNDFETSKGTYGVDTPEEYWTEARVANLKLRLADAIKLLQSSDCDSTCDK